METMHVGLILGSMEADHVLMGFHGPRLTSNPRLVTNSTRLHQLDWSIVQAIRSEARFRGAYVYKYIYLAYMLALVQTSNLLALSSTCAYRKLARVRRSTDVLKRLNSRDRRQRRPRQRDCGTPCFFPRACGPPWHLHRP